MKIEIKFQSKESLIKMMAHFKSHISMFYGEATRSKKPNHVVIDTNLSKNEGLVLAALDAELSINKVTDYTILNNNLEAESQNHGVCQEN